MIKLGYGWLLGLLLLGYWLGYCQTAAAEQPVAPFKARFQVSSHGFALGEAVVTLRYEKNTLYRLRVEVDPDGAASLLLSGSLYEDVIGEFRNGVPLPGHYRFHHEGFGQSRQIEQHFDWQNKVVQARKNDRSKFLPLNERIVDSLSAYLLVMLDLRQNQLQDRYTIVYKKELRTFEVQSQAEEWLETPLGRLRTIRLIGVRQGKDNRFVKLWFAPELDYLLVQFVREKKGREMVRFLLQSVRKK